MLEASKALEMLGFMHFRKHKQPLKEKWWVNLNSWLIRSNIFEILHCVIWMNVLARGKFFILTSVFPSTKCIETEIWMKSYGIKVLLSMLPTAGGTKIVLSEKRLQFIQKKSLMHMFHLLASITGCQRRANIIYPEYESFFTTEAFFFESVVILLHSNYRVCMRIFGFVIAKILNIRPFIM